MNALDVISATAGVATALGVAFAAFQLRASRQQRQSEFELRFSDRYDDVVARVPLEMLLGEQEYDPNNRDARRAFYDYFELCEQECYYRQQKRIGDQTWNDWVSGIRSNHAKASFRSAWIDLAETAPNQFETFRKQFPRWDPMSTGGRAPAGPAE